MLVIARLRSIGTIGEEPLPLDRAERLEISSDGCCLSRARMPAFCQRTSAIQELVSRRQLKRAAREF